MTVCTAAAFIETSGPILDCPIAIYERHDGLSSGPRVEAYRDGAPTDITFTITKSENVSLDVEQRTLDCVGNIVDVDVVPLPYRRYELALYGLEPGDVVYIDHVRLDPATSGACAEPAPAMAQCELPSSTACPSNVPESDPHAWTGDDSDASTDENLSIFGDDMNCNAGGAGSLIVALSLLGVVARRRKA